MSEEEAAAPAEGEVAKEEEAEPEYGSLSMSMLLYGLLADLLMIGPVVMYILLDDTVKYAKYHQAYINMLAASYGPLSLVWLFVVFADGSMARDALKGAVEMAGLGPVSLLWVGYLSFLMGANAAGKLKESENTVFVIVYGVGNLVLLVLHALLAPSVLDWAANAPLPVDKPTEPSPEEEEEGEEGEEEEEE